MKPFLFQNDSMEHFFSVCMSVNSNRIRCLANTPYVYSYMNLASCHQKTINFFNLWILKKKSSWRILFKEYKDIKSTI